MTLRNAMVNKFRKTKKVSKKCLCRTGGMSYLGECKYDSDFSDIFIRRSLVLATQSRRQSIGHAFKGHATLQSGTV